MLRGRRMLAAAVVACVGAAWTVAPCEEEPALKRGLRILAEDAGAVFSSPARWRRKGWTAFAAITAGSLLLINRDEETRDQVRESDAPDREQFADRIEWLGRPETGAVLPWVSYAAASLAGSARFKETSALAFEAWLLSAAATAVLKGATARAGPTDAGENDFWKGGDYFPSGHTSRTFAIAAVFAGRHGRRAAWIGYPLAALVGLARIDTDAHWASDVAAGAALGIAIGSALAKRHPLAPAAAGAGDGAPSWGVRPVRDGVILELYF